MTRVLVVDDSATSRRLLVQMLRADPRMEVIGEAADGQQAVALTLQTRPDVVLMDIVMPIMDGLQATQTIMQIAPTPIVMISGAVAGQEAEVAFRALRQGALTLLAKPVAPTHPDYADQAAKLVSTVRAMAGVRVIRHHAPPSPVPEPANLAQAEPAQAVQIVGIVASTGGPAALVEILSRLEPAIRVPILIVQHISIDFLPALREWLQSACPLPVDIARAGEAPQPGSVYLAPGGAHLRMSGLRQFEGVDKGTSLYVPSGNVLLASLAEVYGPAAAGVVLTGMGDDGVEGLQRMAQAGAITIAQNEATSVVFGMPQEAIRRHAAQHVLSLIEISALLNQLTTTKGVPG